MKKDLEIFIITYNRAAALGETLEYLAGSNFMHHRITVLDNHSLDNTSVVCADYSKKLPDFNYVVHPINIGAGANFLRAFEISNATYTWVLCDDDILDFSHLNDVEQVLKEGEVDLLHVGSHPMKPWVEGGKYDTIKSLYSRGYPYFKYASFLPANIFKTNVFQNSYLISGYNNVVNAYPHMPYLLDLYEKDAAIYLSERRLVTARLGGQSYSQVNWYRWWANTCELLNDKDDVRSAFFDQWKDVGDGSGKACLEDVFYFIRDQSTGDKDYFKRFIKKYFNASDKAFLRNSKIRHDFKINKLLEKIRRK